MACPELVIDRLPTETLSGPAAPSQPQRGLYCVFYRHSNTLTHTFTTTRQTSPINTELLHLRGESLSETPIPFLNTLLYVHYFVTLFVKTKIPIICTTAIANICHAMFDYYLDVYRTYKLLTRFRFPSLAEQIFSLCQPIKDVVRFVAPFTIGWDHAQSEIEDGMAWARNVFKL